MEAVPWLWPSILERVILGEQLRALLREHGDMKMVEVKVQRWQVNKQINELGGRWCTKQYLAEKCHYTPAMITNSFNHARSKGLVRVNPVHKEEEAKLVLDDTFLKSQERGESTNMEAAGTVEETANVYKR